MNVSISNTLGNTFLDANTTFIINPILDNINIQNCIDTDSKETISSSYTVENLLDKAGDINCKVDDIPGYERLCGWMKDGICTCKEWGVKISDNTWVSENESVRCNNIFFFLYFFVFLLVSTEVLV